ncbi:MAG: hypothetical protein IPI44_17820 [Sulfuritalea sp.]|nr:hypothetical protein [Sulfuritalea sp.]
MQRIVDGSFEMFRLVRFADEFGGAVAQGLDRRIDLGVGADDDHRGGQRQAVEPLQNFYAADIRQVEVEQDDIEIMFRQPCKGFLATAALDDFPSLARQQQGADLAQARFVLDDQQTFRSRRGRNLQSKAPAGHRIRIHQIFSTAVVEAAGIKTEKIVPSPGRVL